jgi:hypothetical protein
MRGDLANQRGQPRNINVINPDTPLVSADSE